MNFRESQAAHSSLLLHEQLADQPFAGTSSSSVRHDETRPGSGPGISGDTKNCMNGKETPMSETKTARHIWALGLVSCGLILAAAAVVPLSAPDGPAGMELLKVPTVAMATSLCLLAPLLLYEVNRLLRAVSGLPPRLALWSTVAAGSLFALGAGFCYVVILPVTLRFLLSFGGENVEAGISVSRYLSMSLGLSAACGVTFELPLVTPHPTPPGISLRALPHRASALCHPPWSDLHSDYHADTRRLHHEHSLAAVAGPIRNEHCAHAPRRAAPEVTWDACREKVSH